MLVSVIRYKEVHLLAALNKQQILRQIPPVNQILEDDTVNQFIQKYGRNLVLFNIRQIIEAYKKDLEYTAYKPLSREQISEYIIDCLKKAMIPNQFKSLQKVINATGIILHTNLGRAPLPHHVLNAVYETSSGYSNLEFNLESGARGSRYWHIESVLKEITGAESAMVVNNNAAAVFLCLNTLANDREVIVSRGQQVEIGGSFRIPDIIVRSGARMVEIGTTNKTHLRDYENAITDSTAILLKVHTSNFKMLGFTQEVPLKAIADLGKKHNLWVMEDLGSGSLIDLTRLGLPYEPTVQDSIHMGADLVTFSGDKLLGGPQAGIIVGKKALIDKVKANPLARMLRVDKMTLTALEVVLHLYLYGSDVVTDIPVLKMIAKRKEQLEEEAVDLRNHIINAVPEGYDIDIVDDEGEVGGGSLPGVVLEGKAVAVKPISKNVNTLQRLLRKMTPPVIGRIRKDRILFNVRTLNKEDYAFIARSLKQVLKDEWYETCGDGNGGSCGPRKNNISKATY